MGLTNAAATPRLYAFEVMCKPSGPSCNLRCIYCFYREKERLYPEGSTLQMSSAVLESYVTQLIQSQRSPEITFTWQGGEPTLRGLPFFQEALRLQRKHADGKVIRNAIQTNGTRIDDCWAAFFEENDFLVGVSLDGPQELHDPYRVSKGGHGTFELVMDGLDCLRKRGVEFNLLAVVGQHNAEAPLEVYRFLKQVGDGFIQFVPVVERIAHAADGLHLARPSASTAQVSPWSVRPRQYGAFLCRVFDEWVRNDVGRHFVQTFDVALEAWVGLEPKLCVFREVCGDALALEHNGDLYSCDHFVYPEHRLGNIQECSLAELVRSPRQRRFGLDKRDTLPRYCLDCRSYFVCHGDCPKHRFDRAPDGRPGLSYLCEGYKQFFNHVDPYMSFMARAIENRRAPATVMRFAWARDRRASGKARPGRNDRCWCGSGKKYKRCCGA